MLLWCGDEKYIVMNEHLNIFPSLGNSYSTEGKSLHNDGRKKKGNMLS